MNELALFNSFFNHALNDTMGDFNFGTSFSVPKVDVKETKDAYMLEMDLPGMTEKDVNVELDHNVLTISSHHEEKKEEQNKNAKKDESKMAHPRTPRQRVQPPLYAPRRCQRRTGCRIF